MIRTARRLALIAILCAGGVVVPAVPAFACQDAFFSPSSYTVDENDGAVVLTVRNPGGLDRKRTVGYTTTAGTAKAGSDFVPESGTLAFSPTVQTHTIDIALINDGVNEGQQRFGVKLKAKDGSCIVELGPEAVVLIDDDDTKPEPTPTRDTDGDPPKPPSGGSGGSDGTSGGSGSGGTTDGSGSSSSGDPSGDGLPPAPSLTPTDASPTAQATRTVYAAVPLRKGGGLSGPAIFGLVLGLVFVGSVAVVAVRQHRAPSTPPPS